MYVEGFRRPSRDRGDRGGRGSGWGILECGKCLMISYRSAKTPDIITLHIQGYKMLVTRVTWR
jgi:hypothetical protein